MRLFRRNREQPARAVFVPEESSSPCDAMPFRERLRHARSWQRRSPLATCYRCHMPWDAVTPRSVQYKDGRGGFAICEPCWKELGTAEARIPFYLLLPPMWATWDLAGESETDIDTISAYIEESVRRESAKELVVV